MKMTNNEIYTYANNLAQAFEDKDQKLPIKISFYLQKNKETLIKLAQDIEQSRMAIAQSYGELDEEQQQYIIPGDKMDDVSKELNDLFNLEQEVQIYKVSIDNFNEDLSITNAQMEALMFMID